MEARIPPTERWPFSPSNPAAVDSLTNAFSRSSLASRNVTFMQAPARLLGGRPPEAGPVELGVQLAGLALVDRGDRRQAALVEQPLDDEAEDIHAEGRRRVVERTVLGLDGVVEHRVERRARPREQVLTDDHERHAGRPEVLLRARVDQAVPARRRSAR